MNKEQNLNIRWVYLVLGVVALLFGGIIYAWSILRSPLQAEFGWTGDQMALNFTLTMSTFCLGGFLGGNMAKKLGGKVTLVIAAVLACAGFVLGTGMNSVAMLYLTYGVMSGLGIGIAYNVIISTIGAWFPDKKGLSSGIMMMGFGASSLVLGSVASGLINGPGWRTCFTVLGIGNGVILLILAFVLKRPGADVVLPQPERKAGKAGGDDVQGLELTPGEMVRRPTFWLAFLYLVTMSAVGNTTISFTKQLAESVGAATALATTMVGVLSVCNGLGRLMYGALFDSLGRKKTMLISNIVAIAAASVTLLSVVTKSVPLCVVGLVITGVSYGAGPTISPSLVNVFYGQKNFPVNFSVMNFNLMGASIMATVASKIQTAAGGGFVAPMIFLVCLSVVSLFLQLSVKRP